MGAELTDRTTLRAGVSTLRPSRRKGWRRLTGAMSYQGSSGTSTTGRRKTPLMAQRAADCMTGLPPPELLRIR